MYQGILPPLRKPALPVAVGSGMETVCAIAAALRIEHTSVSGPPPVYGIIRYMLADVVKMEPKSEGITTPRKKRPKELAIITECCTGCAGSPACVPYCPVADCMYWIPDPDHPPFGRIDVDPFLCIGCKKCVSKGPDGAFLDGCPWDAIEMIPIEDVETQIGVNMPV
jgi:ferredoxin